VVGTERDEGHVRIPRLYLVLIVEVSTTTISSIANRATGAFRQSSSRSLLSRKTVVWLFLLPGLIVLLAGFILPVGKVLVGSFLSPGLTLQNYADMVQSVAVRRVALTTLRICSETTFITIVAGYVVAYVITHLWDSCRRLALFCVLIPFWLSVLARAFAWVTLLRSNGLINSAMMHIGMISRPLPLIRSELGVVIGMVHYLLPYAILPLLASFKDVDSRLIAAARGMGAGPATAFWRVFFPLSISGVAGATTLVFVFSLGFYVTPAILGGGKSLMAAEMIAVSINTMRWELAGAMSTSLLVIVLLILGVMAKLIGFRRLFGLPS
jgi:putative spermidine/putrescine transport system permease protein